MQNLTVQKLCIGLVVLAFFVLAPWMTSELLEGNTLPLITLLAVGFAALFARIVARHEARQFAVRTRLGFILAEGEEFSVALRTPREAVDAEKAERVIDAQGQELVVEAIP